MDLGYKLKTIRESRKVTQQELADLLNISQKTYSNIESNLSKLWVSHLIKLSKFLQFDLQQFFKTVPTENKKANKIEKLHDIEDLLSESIDTYKEIIKDKNQIIRLLKENNAQLKKQIKNFN